ncbi:hypothetical protein GMI69_09930 [Eggerthellaceae bacterium zg-887]|uniref:hypothetical protein n=1 Tax=Xiamenia xianingshaonis TaxID=2682776 RepID=UPI00140D3403|nr:hypothetical protein [Xiamenia xianingshaonis]NHM16953.1 hypothetical protein [Xiamenia xianingshaonis]
MNDPMPPAPHENSRVLPPDESTLKRARTMILVGNIAGPVSLFVGGILLGSVGLACAAVARRNVASIAEREGAFQPTAQMMRRSATIAIVICLVAIAINLVTAIMLFPQVMEAVQSGNFANLGLGRATSGATTTWG